MAKKFMFRGFEIEQLQAMELKEFVKLLNTRQRRTLKDGLSDVQKKFMAKVRQNKGKDKIIRTHLRDMIVIPEMIGSKIGIYDGRQYQPVIMTEAMLGHYLGEYSLTRHKVKHSSPGFGATRSSKFVPLK